MYEFLRYNGRYGNGEAAGTSQSDCKKHEEEKDGKYLGLCKKHISCTFNGTERVSVKLLKLTWGTKLNLAMAYGSDSKAKPGPMGFIINYYLMSCL